MTIEDLEKAVAKLPPSELACFDQKIERDAKSGKFDRMADQALDDLRKGPHLSGIIP